MQPKSNQNENEVVRADRALIWTLRTGRFCDLILNTSTNPFPSKMSGILKNQTLRNNVLEL